MKFTKPPMVSPGCISRGTGCHCGMSCCTCKKHCGRDYCNKKSRDEIEARNERIDFLTRRINCDKDELKII